MRAVVARELGPPDLLTIEDWPPRAPAAGELRLRIHAAGVGFVDGLRQSDAARPGRIECGRGHGGRRQPIAAIIPLEQFVEAMHLAASGTLLGRVVMQMV